MRSCWQWMGGDMPKCGVIRTEINDVNLFFKVYGTKPIGYNPTTPHHILHWNEQPKRGNNENREKVVVKGALKRLVRDACFGAVYFSLKMTANILFFNWVFPQKNSEQT
mmetsp:Transcript_4147/g.4266  ORF Transcript_4147/g.4266 Transcript_4147/m.4266 type:complete len:109 (-) Transcript_4147:112-438(-)